ncbi:MAG TPA: hypothetical protein VFX18_01955 [Candidatus Nitrosocosmicus sp.]|nr:hypothetical protein [Candidatus Nitrosocosmicus sp.]
MTYKQQQLPLYWIKTEDYDKALEILLQIPGHRFQFNGHWFRFNDEAKHILELNGIRPIKYPEVLDNNDNNN